MTIDEALKKIQLYTQEQINVGIDPILKSEEFRIVIQALPQLGPNPLFGLAFIMYEAGRLVSREETPHHEKT